MAGLVFAVQILRVVVGNLGLLCALRAGLCRRIVGRGFEEVCLRCGTPFLHDRVRDLGVLRP